MNEINISSSEDLECQICERKYHSKYYLKVHLEMHSEGGRPKPHVCTVCSSAFSTKLSLNSHLIVHSNERRYQCSICPEKSYKTLMLLEQHHVAKHIDQPFVIYGKVKKVIMNPCMLCDRVFRRKYTLEAHIRNHMGEKPCKCNFCDKAFANLSNLNRHMIEHNRNPNQCKFCDFVCSSAESLQKHQREHDQFNRYQCRKCSECFKLKYERDDHEKVHHRRITKDASFTQVPNNDEKPTKDEGLSAKTTKSFTPGAISLIAKSVMKENTRTSLTERKSSENRGLSFSFDKLVKLNSNLCGLMRSDGSS